MSLANSNGPRWIRKQKALSDRNLAGAGPIRRFLAALFGRTSGSRRPLRAFGPDEGDASAGSAARRLPRVPVLAGGAARRLEDEPG